MQSNILNKYAHPSRPGKVIELKNSSFRAYDKIERYAYTDCVNQGDMKQQLGCIIFSKKKMVSNGHNFHSFGKTHTCSFHAEMNAIYKHMKLLGLWINFRYLLYNSYKTTSVFHRLKGDLVKTKLDDFFKKSPTKLKKKLKEKTQKYKMYIYRSVSNGLSLAKPCAECYRWIYIASMIGINYDIHYTDEDGKLKKFDLKSPPSQYIPINTYF